MFPDIFHDPENYFIRTHIVLLVIATTNVLKDVICKFACGMTLNFVIFKIFSANNYIGLANKKQFMSQIIQALFYEKMLVSLLVCFYFLLLTL